MRVREYCEADLDALRAMHRAQGFDYALPNLTVPSFVSKLVLEDEDSAASKNGDSTIMMASLARLTCEMYLLVDPHAGTPRDRYARLLELHRAGAADLRARGLDDAHALFLEAVGEGAPGTQGNSPTHLPYNTLPSTPLTVNLSAATCAGTNCDATATMPACPTARWLGWNLFTATGSTSTPPANSAFAMQYPTIPGTLGNGGDIPCGSAITLSTLNPGPPPPTVDNTECVNGGAPCPGWRTSTQTDPQLWEILATTMGTTAYTKGVGGLYTTDEPSYYSMPEQWHIYQTVTADTLNLPVSGVLISSGMMQLWRDVEDLDGEDPYGYDANKGSDEYATAEAATGNCTFYQSNNSTASLGNCWPSRTDDFVDDAAGRG